MSKIFGTQTGIGLAVTMGQMAGYSSIDKFGENPSIDIASVPEDIWELGGTYIYDADNTAPIVSLISDNVADTMEICIEGLDIDGNFVAQFITLTGTTRVALTTPLWRVYRMYNNGSSDIAGAVYCYIGAGGVPVAADTRATIDNGNNQSLMCLYTVPKGNVGFLFKGELGMSRSVAAGIVRASYYSRRLGKIFRVKKRISIANSGTSAYFDERSFPDIIPSLTDIKLTAESVSANSIGVFGTLDIMLVPESQFSNEYLIAIGQPGY